MTFLAFLGALSLSVLAFELLNVFQSAFSTFGGNRLSNFTSQPQSVNCFASTSRMFLTMPGRYQICSGLCNLSREMRTKRQRNTHLKADG